MKSEKKFSDYPDLLTFKEMCTLLNLGKNTAYKILTENRVPYLKLGREYRIPKIYLLQFIDSEAKSSKQN